jgi:hypothetical protein
MTTIDVIAILLVAIASIVTAIAITFDVRLRPHHISRKQVSSPCTRFGGSGEASPSCSLRTADSTTPQQQPPKEDR